MKVKDPKKVAAGRAGAATRKAKQERPWNHSPTLPAGEADIPPRVPTAVAEDLDGHQKDLEQPEKHQADRGGLTNWIPWLIGACLMGRALMFFRNVSGGGRPR